MALDDYLYLITLTVPASASITCPTTSSSGLRASMMMASFGFSSAANWLSISSFGKKWAVRCCNRSWMVCWINVEIDEGRGRGFVA